MVPLKENKHLGLAVAINLLLIGLLTNAVWENNDKALVLVIILYPLLLLVNATIWIVLATMRKASARVYKITTIGLIVVFMPVLILAMFY
jgi:hypothetical protein